MINRRTLLAGGSATVAAALLFGRSSDAQAARFPVTKTSGQWRRQLGPRRYHILREAGTERPFSSPLNNEKRRGRYSCAGCARALFSSAAKFDSGTGWPSFYRPLPGAVVPRGPRSTIFGTEILCARCGGHLGHVFNDGPKPTGLRYCINGLALSFQPA